MGSRRSAPAVVVVAAGVVGVAGLLGLAGCGKKGSREVVQGIAIVNVADTSEPAAKAPGASSGGGPTAAPLTDPMAPPNTAVSVDVSDTYPAHLGPNEQTLDTVPVEGAYSATLNVREAIRKARAQAALDSRLVLLNFGNNSCENCALLDELFQTAGVREFYNDRFVEIHIDLGEFERNMDVAAEYGHVADRGIPALSVIDPSGSLLGDTRNGELSKADTITATMVARFLSRFA